MRIASKTIKDRMESRDRLDKMIRQWSPKGLKCPNCKSNFEAHDAPNHLCIWCHRDLLKTALIQIHGLGQETCATHEDQCIRATQIAQLALVPPPLPNDGAER